MKADFMIIGAQKSGTTNLAGQLAQHPRICFSTTKEPGYFSSTNDWRAGLADYHKLYTPTSGQLCGEASTMYTFIPEHLGTHTRLHEYNPDLKFIYIMRQPVERILSHYAFRLSQGRVKEADEQVLFSDASYINRSRYGVQIRPYIETFGRDRVLLLLFEEYIKDEASTLKQIAQFLSIDPAGFDVLDPAFKGAVVGAAVLSEQGRSLKSSALGRTITPLLPGPVRKVVKKQFSRTLEKKPEISAATREALWRLLIDDVVEIEALMGRRLDGWRRGYEAWS